HHLVAVQGNQLLVIVVAGARQGAENARRDGREQREEPAITGLAREAVEQAMQALAVIGCHRANGQLRERLASIHNLNLVSLISERKRTNVTPCAGQRSASRNAPSRGRSPLWANGGRCS